MGVTIVSRPIISQRPSSGTRVHNNNCPGSQEGNKGEAAAYAASKIGNTLVQSSSYPNWILRRGGRLDRRRENRPWVLLEEDGDEGGAETEFAGTRSESRMCLRGLIAVVALWVRGSHKAIEGAISSVVPSHSRTGAFFLPPPKLLQTLGHALGVIIILLDGPHMNTLQC